MLDESGPAFVEAFLSVLRNVTKEETVQYVLALLLQMLSVNPSRAKLFHQSSDMHLSSVPDPYTVFLRLLQRPDWFTQEKACKLLTAVIETRPKRSFVPEPSSSSATATDPAEQAITSFIEWLCAQLRRPSNPQKSVPTAVSALGVLLKDKGTRALFLRSGGVQLLAPLLKSSNTPTNSQLLYEICLCVWQLSFTQQGAEVIAQAGLIKPLVEVCRFAQKEKVFRTAICALKNLLQYGDHAIASDMVEAGLPKIVATRRLQKWGDEDIVDALDVMDEKLKEGIQILSSFEKYKKEVLSGSLDWSPMHTSETFWRQNIDKFEDKDFQILRVLLKLIEASREMRTLAVGCHDLGQFITYHPQGRYIVTNLRGKELVMRLMAHPDTEVQKQALLCVQKIMLSRDKLDFLQTDGSA